MHLSTQKCPARSDKAEMSKKISIVTVVFNDSLGLRRTLESIFFQRNKDYEVVVIDGGSNDGTLEVAKTYGDKIGMLVSESDDGIYHAMNKGLSLSTGEWMIFMNAGDELHSNDTLSLAAKQMQQADITFFGRAKIIDEHQNSWLYPANDVTSITIDNWLRDKLPNHQATFFPRSFYSTNEFNLDYVIASDSDYKLRALQHGYEFLDLTVCNFYLGGLSSDYTCRNALRQFRDRLRRKSGQGGWSYAINGLLRAILKILANKIFGRRSHGIIEKFKKKIKAI